MRTNWALGATLALMIAAIVTPLWSVGHAAPPTQRGEESTCSGLDRETGLSLQSRSITPNTILDCETAAVSVTVGADCDKVPLHVVLNIDRSGSMVGQPMRDVKAAARALVLALDMEDPKNEHIKLGLVSHGDPANINSYLTDRSGTILGAVGKMNAGGEDNLPDSLSKTGFVLRRGWTGDDNPFKIAVVLSDGGQTYPPERAVPGAGRLKGDGVLVISICADNGTPGGCNAMRQLASSGQYYFQARGTSGLNRIFTEIADQVTNIRLRTMTVEETLPVGLELVPDSIVPEPRSVDTRGPAPKITWQLNFPAITQTVGYQVKPSAITTYTLATNETTFNDSQDRPGEVVVPTGVLTVSGPCEVPKTPTPTPTDTPTPTPTDTPGPTPTNTPTPTATPTNTPTPTPVPEPLYLPILNPWRCIERDQPSDTVLVIDASTSMRLDTLSGRPKIEAAQEGARIFVDLLREVDRAAIVAFNSQATLMAPLTGDHDALRGAIDAIETAPWTRIDLALDAAAAELASERAGEGHLPVIVLMTDGHPSQTTEAAVREAAERARAPGTLVFAIGVGPDLKHDLMVDIAGDPSRTYHVEDAEALADIYREIARTIPCKPPPGSVALPALPTLSP